MQLTLWSSVKVDAIALISFNCLPSAVFAAYSKNLGSFPIFLKDVYESRLLCNLLFSLPLREYFSKRCDGQRV